MAKRSANMTSFDHLTGIALPIVTHRAGETLWRIHRTGRDPLYFGPPRRQPLSGRFDAPRHEYGVCYAGLTVEAAFAETLLHNPSSRLVSSTDLAVRSVSSVLLVRAVRLVQLHGAGLNRLGLSTDTVHGRYAVCRRLGLAVWNHARAADGIEYRSRFDNDVLCVALFDRARDAVATESTVGLLDDPHWLADLLDHYELGLDP